MSEDTPFHRKDLGFNLATSNRFVVVIPIAPVVREFLAEKGFEDDVLEMNVFGTVAPNFDYHPIRTPIMAGREASLIGNRTTSDPVKFDFMVDDKFFNYYTLYYWGIKCRNHVDGTAHRWAGADGEITPNWPKESTKPGNPNVSPYVEMSIIAMDNFDKPVLQTNLRGAHPAALGGLQLIQQQGGEQYLKSSLTVSYDESEIIWLPEEKC